MRKKQEYKIFYILLRACDGSVHEGIIEARTMDAVEKKVFLSKRKLRKNPFIELKGIDEKGNYNNTYQMINMRNVGMVEIFESKDDCLKCKRNGNLILGTVGKSRKNKIVSLNEFSFNLLPQKWLSIKKVMDGNGEEKVEIWYEL